MEGQNLSQELLDYFQNNATKPLSVQEIEELLGLSEADEFTNLVKTLNELENSGQLIRTRKNRYGLPEKMNLIRGTIQMHAKALPF